MSGILIDHVLYFLSIAHIKRLCIICGWSFDKLKLICYSNDYIHCIPPSTLHLSGCWILPVFKFTRGSVCLTGERFRREEGFGVVDKNSNVICSGVSSFGGHIDNGKLTRVSISDYSFFDSFAHLTCFVYKGTEFSKEMSVALTQAKQLQILKIQCTAICNSFDISLFPLERLKIHVFGECKVLSVRNSTLRYLCSNVECKIECPKLLYCDTVFEVDEHTKRCEKNGKVLYCVSKVLSQSIDVNLLTEYYGPLCFSSSANLKVFDGALKWSKECDFPKLKSFFARSEMTCNEVLLIVSKCPKLQQLVIINENEKEQVDKVYWPILEKLDILECAMIVPKELKLCVRHMSVYSASTIYFGTEYWVVQYFSGTRFLDLRCDTVSEIQIYEHTKCTDLEVFESFSNLCRLRIPKVEHIAGFEKECFFIRKPNQVYC